MSVCPADEVAGGICVKTIGIDIGTTTISLAAADCTKKKLLASRTIPNDSFMKTGKDWEAVQDTDKILAAVEAELDEMLRRYPDIERIGLTGQMHGIVYTYADGRAASPLYTWQDRRGELPGISGKTLIEELKEVHGVSISSGYGLLTHIYNERNGLVPDCAVSLCTIADCVGMALTGRKLPLLHVSNAASLGFFNSETGESGAFDRNLLKQIGINTSILPQTTWELKEIGRYREIPVTVALGDNQAGFYGSVGKEKNVLLLNMGTGGQVSIITDRTGDKNERAMGVVGVEERPYIGPYADRTYLCVGASLCGGKAYAVLERFFREYVKTSAGNGADLSQYAVMELLAGEERERHRRSRCALNVVTAFNGTRSNPAERGSIGNISVDNFTPGNLVWGVMEGMARELYEIYDAICRKTGTRAEKIAASGNGIRKNRVLKEVCEEVFGEKICLAECEEEAAYGAALSAGNAADYCG